MSVQVLGEFALKGRVDQIASVLMNSGKPLRVKHGSEGLRFFRVTGAFDRVFVLMTWPDQASFDAWVADDEYPTMLASGGVGDVTYTVLEQLVELDA